jgi:hypothetical protein
VVSLSLTLLIALAASDDKGPVGVHLTTSMAAERIPLQPLRGPIELVADPFGARIELRTTKPQPALAAQISNHAGSICPTVTTIAGGIELRCRTRRFEAILSTEGSKRFLDIQELRGLPWRAGPGGPPSYHYEPFRVGLGPPCPGQNAVSRGECALLAGRLLAAATEFRSAIDSTESQMAALRLGDMSLATGDPATAIGWYRRAGTAGTFGRMARTRVCEIEGSCLGSSDVVRRVFDPRGLPDPLRAEMSVRGIRAEAFAGRFDSSTRMLWQMIHGGSLSWVCREGGEIICRRVLLEGLRQAVSRPAPQAKAAEADAQGEKAEAAPATPAAPEKSAGATATPPAPAPAAAVTAGKVAERPLAPASKTAERSGPPGKVVVEEREARSEDEPSEAEMAIEVYLALPGWDHGPLAAELSSAAADLAKHLGAPVFGGNMLSAVAPGVAVAVLPAHLLKAAELYLDGDDIARTRLVIEYARTRLGKRMSGRWIALEKRLAARVASDEEAADAPPSTEVTIDADEVMREIASARAASARARLARADNQPQKQGDKP